MVRSWAYQDWMGNIPVVPDAAAAVESITTCGSARRNAAIQQEPVPLQLPLVLGLLRRADDRLGRPHDRHRQLGYGHQGAEFRGLGRRRIRLPRRRRGNARHSAGALGFPGFGMVWEHATAIGRGPEARDHGVAFHGNNGLLVVDRGGWEVFSETETKRAESLSADRRSAKGRGRRGLSFQHVKNFLDCMQSRKGPTSDVEIGHNSMIACHLGNIAFRLGRQIKWDVDKEEVIGDKEAQRLVMREYRAPWVLPRITRPTSSAAR